MRSNYKRLGEYIELVSITNSNLYYGENDVIGVSNNKEIIQTIANNEGRDFDNFYIVAPDAFIYNSRTSRMGNKVGLGYNGSGAHFITSFNNTVFRVKNEDLLPMFLYMWFKRPEFDRYARFHSWGSSTEIFSWEEMCNTLLPVPNIDKQRELVKEYNTTEKHIKLNEQLIQKLEETAQAIYKQWFVDFEFPDEEGKPYKSNGGEMEWNEESELEVPKGWDVKNLLETASYVNRGITPTYVSDGGICVLNQKCIRNNTINYSYSRQHDHTKKNIDNNRRLQEFDILINSTGEGTLGRVGLIKETPDEVIVDTHITIVRSGDLTSKLYLWFNLCTRTSEIENLAEGSTGQTELGRENLGELKVTIPDMILQDKFSELVSPIISYSSKLEKELPILISLRDLLLSKLATIEN
jgi:type I restriction enzyme, S subunit